MRSSKLWMCGLVVFVSLVNLPTAQAQRHPNMSGMIRRYQQMAQQQAKANAAAQKAYMEWMQKVQAEAAAKKAAHIADLQRKKGEAEVERQARIERNKQHNAELAANPKKTRTSGKAADGEKFEKDQADKAKAGDAKSDKSGADKEADKEDPESGEKETSEKESADKAPVGKKKELTAKSEKPAKATAPVKK